MTGVIVLTGESPGGLAAIRSMGRRGIPVKVFDIESRKYGSYSRYATSLIGPDPALSLDGFVAALLSLSREWEGALLIPTEDVLVMALARAKLALAERYRVSAPDLQVVQKCIDKGLTASVAEQAGVAAPKTVKLETLDELPRIRGQVSFPCLVKPCVSSAEFAKTFKVKKLWRVSNYAEMESACMLAHRHGCPVVIQESIPGPDHNLYTYYAYVDSHGKVTAEFTGRKLRQSPPGAGVVTVGESTSTLVLHDLGRRLLNAMDYRGVAGIEFKLDCRDSQFKLVEINPRLGLFFGLPIACGVDFPWVMYEDLVNDRTVPYKPDYVVGLKWISFASDLVSFMRYERRRRTRVLDYWAPYRSPKVWALFNRRDSLPWLVFWGAFWKLSARTVLRCLKERLLMVRPR